MVRDLLAVQAQELRSARLALRARGSDVTNELIDTALTEDRSLVVAWLGRGTLHLVSPEDYPWLLSLTAPGRMTMNRRRLGEEGVPPDLADRAVAGIESILADQGPLTRGELLESLAQTGIRIRKRAAGHLFLLSVLRGLTVWGPIKDGEQALVLVGDWLGLPGPRPLEGLGRDSSLAELARRYLTAHGPATEADLATWIGLPARDARAGLGAIAAELHEHENGLVDLKSRNGPEGRPAACLLPRFDPYMLGWKRRDFAVPGDYAHNVWPGGGIIRATAVDGGGQVVGTWAAQRKGKRLAVTVD
ncbi:MAG: hypothetical protein QOG62_2512, partial [Thermoleophilaceae bacterium]|nr:hypothetical protein [Thermoleophilaceae bacterium]